MFLGFFAWYAGLARGGVARVGQIQLLQPLLTFVWAGLVLGEHIGAGTVLAATGVLASVVVTQRARISHTGDPRRSALAGSSRPAPARLSPSASRK
jgi:drug/metabolite transporter (DMT)-like permease